MEAWFQIGGTEMTDSTQQTPYLLLCSRKRWRRRLALIAVLVSGAVSILYMLPPKEGAIESTNSSGEAVETKEEREVSLRLGRVDGKRYYRRLPFLRVECLNLEVSNRRIELKEIVVEPEDLESTLVNAIAKERSKAIYVWVDIQTRDGKMEQVRSIVEGVSIRTNTPHVYCHPGAFTIFVDDDDLRSDDKLPLETSPQPQ
jgi:hypothetical protein